MIKNILLSGFQSEVSRPNSIYNLSGPPTDAENNGVRPHSALTSYSNFHGQRLPAMGGAAGAVRGAVGNSNNGGNVQNNVTNLTQESLMNVSTLHF